MKYGALSALLIASINMQAAQEGTTRYTILTQSPEQHIQHFGASDAWSMQFLGLWSEKQQEQIADWLFSTENDALGKPKGIGLSGDLIWEPEARNRERLRRFSRAQEPNAFSMLTAPTTGANRLDSASFSSSPSREVCLISSPSATQHPCSIPRTDSQPTQGAAAPSI